MTDSIDLASAINRELMNYAHEVGREVEGIADDVTKKGVKQLRLASPQKTGKYAKGWRVKNVNGARVVHNKHYQLTHLLEKGHAKVGGGRVAGQEHIRPVEEQMIDEFVERTERAIRG